MQIHICFRKNTRGGGGLMLNSYNKIIKRFLSQNTRRRKYYEIGRAGGKIFY